VYSWKQNVLLGGWKILMALMPNSSNNNIKKNPTNRWLFILVFSQMDSHQFVLIIVSIELVQIIQNGRNKSKTTVDGLDVDDGDWYKEFCGHVDRISNESLNQ
jgi:hypothetical protein